MDKPVKLRPKLDELEAMQYNGKNADDIARWVLDMDPMAVCHESHQIIQSVLPSFAMADGNTAFPAYQFIIFQSYHGYEFRLFVGDWIVRQKGGNFTRKTHGEVRRFYDFA